MTDWLAWLRGLDRQTPAAMISVLATEGSAPRSAGTRMIVTPEGATGTIGGGNLEFQAIEQARTILSLPEGSWRIQDFPLGPLLGQCCGGRVRLLVEHIDRARLGWLVGAGEGQVLVARLTASHVERFVGGAFDAEAVTARGERPGVGAQFAERIGEYRRPLYLFGAGHVGQAIVRHAQTLPLRLAWFDTRPLFGSIAGVTLVPDRTVEHCLADAPGDAAVVILTHDHALDYRLVKAALERGETAFTGLIGSATKRARFVSRLARDGIAPAAIGRLACPIGVAGITGKEPDVIAIAVLAQILQLEREPARDVIHGSGLAEAI
jgi:xanthine dehydrogenase accessory factor